MASAEYKKALRQRRVARGLCPRCGLTPPRPGSARCGKCSALGRSTYNPERAAASRRQLKTAVVARYGGKCACCGETTLEFLQIDHVNNDGAAHRRAIRRRAGEGFYKWLRTHSYPVGFQVLCANCNFAKGRYGQCPHERKVRDG